MTQDAKTLPDAAADLLASLDPCVLNPEQFNAWHALDAALRDGEATEGEIDRIAECMWQAEWKRAGNGGLRKIPWTEVAPVDQERFRFVAREVAALRNAEPVVAAAPSDEPVVWQRFSERLGWTNVDASYAVKLAEAGEKVRPLYAAPQRMEASAGVLTKARALNAARYALSSIPATKGGEDDLQIENEQLRTERDALLKRINSPETEDWMAGVPLEAAHQAERHGAAHDAGKTAWDWFWLIGYLSQKAAASQTAGDLFKAKHHTISTAAALLNWHRHLTGENTAMRPGIDPVARGIELAALAQDTDGVAKT